MAGQRRHPNPCTAGVDYFRLDDSDRPPAILESSPIRVIYRRPYLDPDVPNPRAPLTLYKLNRRGLGLDESLYRKIRLVKVDKYVKVVW